MDQTARKQSACARETRCRHLSALGEGRQKASNAQLTGESERLAANAMRLSQEFAGQEHVEMNYLKEFQRLGEISYTAQA